MKFKCNGKRKEKIIRVELSIVIYYFTYHLVLDQFATFGIFGLDLDEGLHTNNHSMKRKIKDEQDLKD